MSVKKLLDMLRCGPTLGSGLANECVGRDLSLIGKHFERLALDRPVFVFTDSVKPLCTHGAGLDPTLVCDVMMLLSSSRGS